MTETKLPKEIKAGRVPVTVKSWEVFKTVEDKNGNEV